MGERQCAIKKFRWGQLRGQIYNTLIGRAKYQTLLQANEKDYTGLYKIWIRKLIGDISSVLLAALHGSHHRPKDSRNLARDRNVDNIHKLEVDKLMTSGFVRFATQVSETLMENRYRSSLLGDTIQHDNDF